MNSNTVYEIQTDLHFDQFPAVELLFQIISQQSLEFDFHRYNDGAEIHFKNKILGNSNRGYLRIFFPSSSKCVLFFHKKSQVPFSRDRFSYGGIIIDEKSTSRYSKKDVEEWIEFLLSGLQPNKRPSSLKKSIPYTIPEDEMSVTH